MRELKPCPMSPNCVSTEAADPGHRMTPIPFAGSAEAAMARLRVIIRAIPRAEVIEEKPDYLVVNFRSRLFGFVDEAEFVVDEAQKVIRFRSGARTGYYDFGVNRSRMERVAEAFRAGR